MPIYVYKAVEKTDCDHCENGFEQLQKISDDPLACCPECLVTVKRVISAANIASSAPSLKESNIAKHGFTQYRKLEKGVYEKTTGKGPEIISDKESWACASLIQQAADIFLPMLSIEVFEFQMDIFIQLKAIQINAIALRMWSWHIKNLYPAMSAKKMSGQTGIETILTQIFFTL